VRLTIARVTAIVRRNPAMRATEFGRDALTATGADSTQATCRRMGVA